MLQQAEQDASTKAAAAAQAADAHQRLKHHHLNIQAFERELEQVQAEEAKIKDQQMAAQEQRHAEERNALMTKQVSSVAVCIQESQEIWMLCGRCYGTAQKQWSQGEQICTVSLKEEGKGFTGVWLIECCKGLSLFCSESGLSAFNNSSCIPVHHCPLQLLLNLSA